MNEIFTVCKNWKSVKIEMKNEWNFYLQVIAGADGDVQKGRGIDKHAQNKTTHRIKPRTE